MKDELAVGSHLAGYRIEGVAGRGGMGVVYIAEHLHLGRRVALKTLSAARGGDPEFRERFIRESRMAARIDHAHIVPIYDAGEADGLLYLAMRLVGGGDLDGLIDTDAPLDLDMTLRMMRQVASGLDTAHAQGLVHRDVKPGNVLLERTRGELEPHCFLADFGLTKHTTSDTALTSTGQLLGTLSYVAPEQIEGLELDGRADQYSLACMLHECLTGAPPFRTDSDSALPLIAAHLHEPPPPLSALRPDLPSALDDALRRALGKSPDQRYPDCTTFIDALEDAAGAPHTTPAAVLPAESDHTVAEWPAEERPAGDEPVEEHPAQDEPVDEEPVHDDPPPPPPAAGVPTTAGNETYTGGRPTPPPPGPPPPPRPPRRGRVAAVVAGALLVLAAGGVLAVQVMDGEDTAGNGHTESPDGQDPDPEPDPTEDPRDPEEAEDGEDGEDPATGEPTDIADPIAFDSQRDGNREIYLARADGTGLRNLTRHPADDRQANWSPDRTEIVFASDRDERFAIYVLGVDDGAVRQLTDGGPDGDFDPDWSPDGQTVVFSRDSGGRRDLYTVGADGSGLRRLTDDAGNAARPAWSPDGERIAFHSDRDGQTEDSLNIFVMQADGSDMRNVTDHPGRDFHPNWSPDGERLTFGSNRLGAANVMVMRADGSGLLDLTQSAAFDDLDPSFSPDGRFVTFESTRDGRHEIYVVDATGGQPIRVTDHPADDSDPDW